MCWGGRRGARAGRRHPRAARRAGRADARRCPRPARSPAWSGSIRCSRWATGDRSWSRSRAGPALLGVAGAHSTTLPWPALRAADPDIIVVAPCGFGVERTLAEMPALAAHPDWRDAGARSAPAASTSPTATSTSTARARCCSIRPRSWRRSCTRRCFRPRTRARSGAAGPERRTPASPNAKPAASRRRPRARPDRYRASAAGKRRAPCARRSDAPPAWCARRAWPSRRAPRAPRVRVVGQPEAIDPLGAGDADSGVGHQIDRRARPRAGTAVDGAGAAAQVGDQLRVGPTPGTGGASAAGPGAAGGAVNASRTADHLRARVPCRAHDPANRPQAAPPSPGGAR